MPWNHSTPWPGHLLLFESQFPKGKKNSFTGGGVGGEQVISELKSKEEGFLFLSIQNKHPRDSDNRGLVLLR